MAYSGMRGRFTLSNPVAAVAELFKLTSPPPELAPRKNIAPKAGSASLRLTLNLGQLFF